MGSIQAFAALAALSAPAGCVIETEQPRPAVAAVAARWSLRNMVDGAVTGCPAGFDTVELVAQAVDDSGALLGDPVSDLFDCSAGSGLGDGLAAGAYQLWIEVRSHDLTALYAQSLSQVLDVRRPDEPFEATILNDGGYFQLAWDLTGATSHRPLACSQINAIDSVTVVSTSVADARRAYDDRFTCEDHAAISGGLLAGSYTVAIHAASATGPLGGSVSLPDQVITARSGVTDLGHVVIPIDGM